MEIKAGVLIIGSLLWDTKNERPTWREDLALSEKKLVSLPIRYGRCSSTRSDTFSMVFSNAAGKIKDGGRAYVVPFKRQTSINDLADLFLKISRAEGFAKGNSTRIFRSWGSVCIIINPFAKNEVRDRINDLWSGLVTRKKAELTREQLAPVIEKFGEEDEEKCLREDLTLNIEIDELFSNQLNEFDVLIATANAVKLKEEINVYPSPSKIAKAMYKSGDYSYFLINRAVSIKTFQDKLILKILRKHYGVHIKDETLLSLKKLQTQ